MDKKSSTPKKQEKAKSTKQKQESAKTPGTAAPPAQPKEPQKTPPTSVPKSEAPTSPPVLSLSDMHNELLLLKQAVLDHSQQITELQAKLARKRAAMPNGKVQIKDKLTGKVYPSKNNTYQSMLKAGDLKELVEKGIFGPEPEKNNFGWFALVRAWPERFEEVKADK